MLVGVAGRHVSTRRRGSIPAMRPLSELLQQNYDGTGGIGGPGIGGSTRLARRRRGAVATGDHKSCALILTRVKLGDIM